jgi:hypothetical protein
MGVIIGDFLKSVEEAEVVEAEDFGKAFSLYFQVLIGVHGMETSTNS